MISIDAFVRFTCDRDLATVAAILSDRLFGGIPFVETDEFDELPGVRLQRPVLLCIASICGEGPEFGLRINSQSPAYWSSEASPLKFVDISEVIEMRIATLEGMRIIPTGARGTHAT